jgi:AcrR family transcriptional regulator
MSSEPESAPPRGRERQRRRTRKAIIDAAAALIARGEEPSVGQIADAADVSRRTVYLYFPTLEHLLADAVLELTRDSFEPQYAAHSTADERVEALVRALQQGFSATETLGRTIIRHTVGAPRDPASGDRPRRGYRRVAWLEEALEPLRGTVPDDRFELLVSALTLVAGWESRIVLEDTRALGPAEAEEVCVWAAQALLAASRDQGNGFAGR